MDHSTIYILIFFAFVGDKWGIVEAGQNCNGPYSGNTGNKPTPPDFGFQYLGNGKFEKQFYNHDYIQTKVGISLSPDGYAEFEVNGRKYDLENRNELTVWDSKERTRNRIELPRKGWYVPEECSTGERKAKSPEDYGFNHVGKGVYVKKYLNANNQEDTIEMRISRRNEAWFTYHPIRDYFPLDRDNGVIEIPEAGGNKPIPLTGWECGNDPFFLTSSTSDYKSTYTLTENPGSSRNGYKFASMGDGIYEKEFRTKDRTVEKIRMRFNTNGLAEWNFDKSRNIKLEDNGALVLKLEDGTDQGLSPNGWHNIRQWYVRTPGSSSPSPPSRPSSLSRSSSSKSPDGEVVSVNPADYGFKKVEEEGTFLKTYIKPDGKRQTLEVTIDENGEVVHVHTAPPNDVWNKNDKKLVIIEGPGKKQTVIPATGWKSQGPIATDSNTQGSKSKSKKNVRFQDK